MADPAPDERDVFAGEFALGVLEGEERAAAQRLVLGDRDFSARVQWWNHRLAAMAEEVGSVDPGEDLWPAILRRLSPPDAEATAMPSADVSSSALSSRRFSGLSLGGAMAGAAAAAAAITLIVANPQTVPRERIESGLDAATDERLIVQMQGADGSFSLAGLVERDPARLSLAVAGLEPQPGAAPELWVVPEGAAPVSLGQIPPEGDFARDLTPAERDVLVAGAALAVTYEDEDSIPNAAPTGEILAVSPLSQV